jgi:hypothetical protein
MHQTKKLYCFTGCHFLKMLKLGIQILGSQNTYLCMWVQCVCGRGVRVCTHTWTPVCARASMCVCVYVHRHRHVCDFNTQLPVLVSSMAYIWEKIKTVKYGIFWLHFEFWSQNFFEKKSRVFFQRNIPVHSFKILLCYFQLYHML